MLLDLGNWQMGKGVSAFGTLKETNDPQPGDIELKRIYLLDRCQGQGLAGELLDVVIAGAAGHRRLVLGTNRDNERALGFYRKTGFEIIGTRQFTVGHQQFDDYILAKPLEFS